MLISKIMTRNPVSAKPELSLTEARALMDRANIGHLPVLSDKGELVGITSRQDLLKASPSAATTLDMYEINYLLSKLTLEKVMTKNVIAVQVDEVVENAARIMADRYIGCLPVMSGTILVGIVTDTDIFRFFVDAFGTRHSGVRITLNAVEKPGQIAAFADAVAKNGGNIVALVTSEGEDAGHRLITLKISGIDLATVQAVAKASDGLEIEDIRG